MTLSICVAQLNFVVGDMAGNARKMIDAAEKAHARGVNLLLTPELALCGYAAEDLYLRPAFIDACDDALKVVAAGTAHLKGLHIVVGHPARPVVAAGQRRERSVSVAHLHNAASVLHAGAVTHTYAKRELPNYQVFDERRYFVPGHDTCVFDVTDNDGQRVRVGLLICEDAWFDAPAADAKAAGAELLAVINASPFHAGKGGDRESAMRVRCQATGLPLVYAHLVGGQDEIVFEGRSFVLAADGSLAGRAVSFEETLFDSALTRQGAGWQITAETDRAHSPEADLWHALVLGVRDYLGKNGFPGAILGLSGGIDSALVLAIAVDALGKDRVRTVMMPSPYTADISWIDARDMAARLGVRYDEIGIAPQFEAFKASLASEFAGLPEDTTEENLQARIRGTVLMTISNKLGWMVLTTGNKSETATGYSTLYGDMAGGFAVIKDVPKTLVYALCRDRNERAGRPLIPESAITKPPSAELRPDQLDSDSLPDYEELDPVIEGYVELDRSIADLVAEGHDPEIVRRVARLVDLNEYKRRQGAPGVRVSPKAFGKDRRLPITNCWPG